MRRERCEYGNRCRFRHINKEEENVDKHRYNERKTNEQIHRNHQYNEHHHVNQLRNANWNQSDNKWKQRNNAIIFIHMTDKKFCYKKYI